MKEHNRIKGRLTLLAHANQMLERIRIMTRELECIQAEIYGRVSEDWETEKGGLLRDGASAQILREFRATLDQVRNMLWLCTEAAREGATNAGVQQPHRQPAHSAAVVRAVAAPEPGSTSSAYSSSASRSGPGSSLSMSRSGVQHSVSFFDRLDRVIDNYVEGGGALVEPGPRRRPKT